MYFNVMIFFCINEEIMTTQLIQSGLIASLLILSGNLYAEADKTQNLLQAFQPANSSSLIKLNPLTEP